MRPWGAALGALCGVMASRSGAASPARAADSHAGDGGSVLRLECADLDAEGRSSFEARARAELVSAPLPAGEVAIACADGVAVVTWWAADGGFRESSLPLPADRPTAVDALLGAVQALRARAVASSTPPGPNPRAPAPEVAETPALRTATVPRVWSRLGAVAGVDAERWQGAIGGAVGARFGARLATGRRWAFALTAGAGWGTAAAQGIHAQTLQAAFVVGYQPSAHVELGLGAEARLLSATATDAAAGTAEQHDWTEGGSVSARYVARLGPLRLAIGPRIAVLAHPFIVEVAGKEVFRIPAVVAGLSVDSATDFVQ